MAKISRNLVQNHLTTAFIKVQSRPVAPVPAPLIINQIDDNEVAPVWQ